MNMFWSTIQRIKTFQTKQLSNTLYIHLYTLILTLIIIGYIQTPIWTPNILTLTLKYKVQWVFHSYAIIVLTSIQLRCFKTCALWSLHRIWCKYHPDGTAWNPSSVSRGALDQMVMYTPLTLQVTHYGDVYNHIIPRYHSLNFYYQFIQWAKIKRYTFRYILIPTMFYPI